MQPLRLLAPLSCVLLVLISAALARGGGVHQPLPQSFEEHDRSIIDVLDDSPDRTLSAEIVFTHDLGERIPLLQLDEFESHGDAGELDAMPEDIDSMSRTIQPNGLENYMLRPEDVPARFSQFFEVQGADYGVPFDRGVDGAAALWVFDYSRAFEDIGSLTGSGSVEPGPPYDFTQSIMVMMTRYESLEGMEQNHALKAEAGLMPRPFGDSRPEDSESAVVLVGEGETAEDVLARWGNREIMARDATRLGTGAYAEVSSLPRLDDADRTTIVYWLTTETWFFTVGRYEVWLMVHGYSDSPAPPADVQAEALAALLHSRLQTAPP